MYLVFDLPAPGSSTFPTAHSVAYWLHREFDRWSTKHSVLYRTKFHKNRLRFILPSETEYHFFLISWDPDFLLGGYTIESDWSRPHVINPPKH